MRFRPELNEAAPGGSRKPISRIARLLTLSFYGVGSMLVLAVSKTVLGRGLGKLMKEVNQLPPSGESPLKSSNASPGVGALLRGGNEPQKSKTQSESETRSRGPKITQTRLLQAALVAGDALLLGLVARLVLLKGGPLETSDLVLCLLALILGAGLTCLALWLQWSR